MPLTGRIAVWWRRKTLSWRWRVWHQLGSPARTLAALDDLLAARGPAGPDVGTAFNLQAASESHGGSRQRGASATQMQWLATRAHVLGQMQRWSEARAQLEQLLALQPDHAAHAFNLGYVCSQLGDSMGAIQAFQKCLYLAPHIDRAWYGLGVALLDQGDWLGAEAAWVRQVSMQPLCPDGYTQLIRLFIQRQDVGAARSWLDRLRDFEPRHALALEPLLVAMSASQAPTPCGGAT